MAFSQIVNASFAGSARAARIEPSPSPGPTGLPDGRAYEQVSPVEKGGNEAGPAVSGEGVYGITTSEGDSVLYASTGPLGEAASGVENFSVSIRSASGWSTRAALPQPPQAPPPHDSVSPSDPMSILPSADLTQAVFTAHNPFTSIELDYANPAFAFSSTYLTDMGGPATWIEAPTAQSPYPPLGETEQSADLELLGASPDLSTVYFEYYGTLVEADAPRRPQVVAGSEQDWGIYEWHAGTLQAAGLLLSGEEDPDGAAGAGFGEHAANALAPDFQNQVSSDGNVLLYASPAPEAESARPSQLYARVGGRTVLVSRSALTGLPSVKGVQAVRLLSQSHLSSWAYGSPDGSHVFFATEEQLTNDAPPNTSLKEYEFDVASETLSYLPEVTPPLLASSPDGSELVFLDSRGAERELAVWNAGHIVDIAPLPAPGEGARYVAPVRLTANGATLVFQTNSPVPGFNSGGLEQVYRYDALTEGLTCVSCAPKGQPQTGSASLSNDALHHRTRLIVDSRGVSEDGSEVFFDTTQSLVPQDTNGRRDVYEWHEGNVSLISSGSAGEARFLDNSASGSDVFFTTTAGLANADTDGSYDVYDARVGGGFPASPPVTGCSQSCATSSSNPAIAVSLASTSLLGAGEQLPGALAQEHKPRKSLSRSQKLHRALRACKKKSARRARRTCEAKAQRRYGKRRRSG